MAPLAKPCALVFGHSFVRRFGKFIDNSQPRDLYRRDLQLFNTSEVKIFGTGGRTVDKTIRFNLNTIRGTAPNVVVMEMGSNDACDMDSDAETIASSLVALTELLISECKLQFIAVCQILPRKHPPFKEHNERVYQINTSVGEKLLHVERTKFWRNRGLIDPLANKYIWPMVHISTNAVTELFTRVIEEPFSSPCLN